jgi:hypothetical protein
MRGACEESRRLLNGAIAADSGDAVLLPLGVVSIMLRHTAREVGYDSWTNIGRTPDGFL